METNDIIMIGAVIIAPILAVQVQKYLEKIRENRNRKIRLFYTLMSTRTSRLSLDHVQSLNLIDLEFYGTKFFFCKFRRKKYKEVINSWKKYHDHLNTPYEPNNWTNESDRLFVSLLFSMSIALGYDYDEVQLKRSAYAPIGHSDYENENLIIRQGMAKIFKGETTFPINISIPSQNDEDKNKQEELRLLLLELLKGERNVNVNFSKKKK